MSKYVIISNLTDEGAKTLKKNAGRIKEVNKELKAYGGKCNRSICCPGKF